MGVDVRTEGRIGWIQLNRPEKLNALNAQMFADFRQALDDLEADPSVRCIIVHGAGRAFCVGFDVDSQRSTDEDARLSAYDDWVGLRKNLDHWLAVWRCTKPVIAAVHGYCMGLATQLAVCCDITVIAEDAVVGWPSLPLGGGLLSPMSCWLIGPKKAKELSYIAGSRLSGTEAHELGWANHAVPAADVLTRAESIARQIARTPPDLLRIKKAALNRMMDLSGFTEVALAGAEFDAIAHDSPGMMSITAKIDELGLKGAMAWFDSQGDDDD